MAEPCDPEVLHARVSVLECNDKRHDDDIKQLWKETTDLKLCAACLPAISSDLVEIKKALNSDVIERGKRSFWETPLGKLLLDLARSGFISVAFIFGLMYLHLFGAK
jgi:hypothetical protein